MDAVEGDPGASPGRFRMSGRLAALALSVVGLAAAAPPTPAVPPAALPAPPGPASESDRAWAFRYAACDDAKVAPLVGQPKEAAIAKVKTMNLRVVRMLYPTTVVTYEVVPQRLTLVIGNDGVVARAFCR